MPDVQWKAHLLDQLTFAWDFMFWTRMEGLTNEEYLWTPVTDIWTVHPGNPTTVDGGEERNPAPFTTIAWRMWHMADVFADRTRLHFGDGERELLADIGANANDGLAILKIAYDAWIAALERMPEDRLAAPCGPGEGPFADYPFAALILHINREFIHHAAECSLIRDLYRQRAAWRG